ncbi:MAG: hypothetical protein PWQ97_22 [Tepidanaerobacteraceae bacterium]|nr:hypothetical protein [Tepidanaerobacteraceae bacterium]
MLDQFVGGGTTVPIGFQIMQVFLFEGRKMENFTAFFKSILNEMGLDLNKELNVQEVRSEFSY